MRGEIISKEYQNITFVNDQDGKEYACYVKDIRNLKPGDALSDEQRNNCMDVSLVLGDSW